MTKCAWKGFSTGLIILLLSSHRLQTVELEPTTLTLSDITGVCVWLRCSIYECDIETSIRVSHYNHDLIVSVYDEPGDNPWEEAQSIYGSLESQGADSFVGLFHDAFVGGGHRVEGGNPNTDHSLRFKEATAIGYPFSSLTDSIADSGYYCSSEAESMEPYLSSGFDALVWRLGLPEMLYLLNLLPGRRVVGSGIQQQWGPVWPRTGFINSWFNPAGIHGWQIHARTIP